MSASQVPSYSDRLKHNLPQQQPKQAQADTRAAIDPADRAATKSTSAPYTQETYQPKQEHIPQTGTEDEDVYILTILTDEAHHARMTDMRKKYFPKKLNKLEAHLTLFHALPQSKLDEFILPRLEEVAKTTDAFGVYARRVTRLSKGVAIGIARNEGSTAGQEIHQRLQEAWKADGFLSKQDAGGCRLHYTIMNKVDDEETIKKALDEVEGSFKGDRGTARGLALWKYDRGFWRWHREFLFNGA